MYVKWLVAEGAHEKVLAVSVSSLQARSSTYLWCLGAIGSMRFRFPPGPWGQGSRHGGVRL